MKTLISILLIFTLVSAQAQRPSQKEAVKTIALFTTSIVLSSMGDGFNDSGSKVLGHSLNAASTGLLLASPFILNVSKENWLWYIASYSFIRVGLFDTSYNLTRGLPISYVGDSSLWDKAIGATKSPPAALIAGKSLFLIVGFSIPIKYF